MTKPDAVGKGASPQAVAGRTPDAIALLEAILPDHQRAFGPDHPNTLLTRNNLANAYQAAGRTQDAIAVVEPLLADLERVLGAEHPNTLRTRNNLANAYQAAGRTQDAITIYEPLLADREGALGTEHANTLRTRGNLANAYQAAGRTDDAIAINEPLVADRERVLGVEHPETAGEPIGRVHCDGSDAVVAQMLLDLGDQRPFLLAVARRDVDPQGVVDLGQAAGEDDVDHDAANLDDAAGLLVPVLVRHGSPGRRATTDRDADDRGPCRRKQSIQRFAPRERALVSGARG